MESQGRKAFVTKLFLAFAAVVVIQDILQRANGVSGLLARVAGYFLPFIYASFFAILIHPISAIFETKLKMKRWIAILCSFIFVLGAIVLLILAVIPGFIDSTAKFIDRAPKLENDLNIYTTKIISYVDKSGFLNAKIEDIKNNAIKYLQDNILNYAKYLSLNIINIFTTFFQIIIGFLLAIFFIYRREYFEKLLENIVHLFMSKEKTSEIMHFFDESRKIFLNYLWGKLIASVFVGLLSFILMFFMKVPYAGLNAVLFGVGNMIPYIGAFLSLTVSIVFVVIENPSAVLYLLIANIVTQQIDGYIISPKIIGKTVGMNSFWVITGVLIGGAVGGIVGMIFGVPAIGVLKYIYHIQMKKVQEKDQRDSESTKSKINEFIKKIKS
ncbi:MAG: AI-2E family transporter [Fusobacteriaceae bacterium]